MSIPVGSGASNDGDDATVAVTIDPDMCVGVGACVAREPQTFVFNDDGTSSEVPGARLPRDRAALVCEACPTGALRVVEDTTTPA